MFTMIQYNNPSELRVLGAQAMLEYRSLAFRLKFNTSQCVKIGWCSPILALVYFSSNTHSFQS